MPIGPEDAARIPEERARRRAELLAFLAFLAERDTRCPGCGYSLRGLTGVQCPECGWVFDLAALRAQVEPPESEAAEAPAQRRRAPPPPGRFLATVAMLGCSGVALLSASGAAVAAWTVPAPGAHRGLVMAGLAVCITAAAVASERVWPRRVRRRRSALREEAERWVRVAVVVALAAAGTALVRAGSP